MLDRWERELGADAPSARVVLYAVLAIVCGALSVAILSGVWETDRLAAKLVPPLLTVGAAVRLLRALRVLHAESRARL